MFCQKCGKQVPDGAAFCQHCGGSTVSPSAAVSPPSQPSPGPAVEYAGFWLRVVATIIDGLILGVVFIVLIIVLVLFAAVVSGVSDARKLEDNPIVILFVLLFYALSIVLPWLYAAYMESSSWQATLGKKMLGLVVTDIRGEPISFWRATGRHFGKIVSGMILYIGFMMAGFTEKKQALHDILAECLVLRTR